MKPVAPVTKTRRALGEEFEEFIENQPTLSPSPRKFTEVQASCLIVQKNTFEISSALVLSLRRFMKDLRSQLADTIRLYTPGDGLHASLVPGVHCIKFSNTDRRTKRRWRACLGVIAQGSKEIVLGRTVYRFGEGDFTAAPIDLPLVSRIASASPEKPFLALLIDLRPQTLAEVAAQGENDLPNEKASPQRAVFVGKASDKMLEAAMRLTELFRTPADAPALGPLVIKEAIYHLLKTPEGPAIRQFVRSGSKTHQVYQAIYTIKSNLSDEVDVGALARAARMSRSAFFEHFKEVTAVSPIQYQKRLRLLEARRLMIEQNETAERSAYDVGYNSASQFSREYLRMFGKSPRRDVEQFVREKRALVS